MIINNRQYWNLIRSIGGLRFRQDTEWEEYFGCQIIGLPDQSRQLVFDNPKHEIMFRLKYEDAMNQNEIDTTDHIRIHNKPIKYSRL